MDEILKQAQELKDLIEKDELVKEYRRVKKLYDSSTELKEIRNKLNQLKGTYNIEERNKLIKQFNEHPLTVNYLNLQNELAEYLKSISNIINN